MNKNLLQQDLTGLRNRQPVIHCITNYVAMNFTANALLAVGASPIMAQAPEEMAQVAQQADALLLNIGTLDAVWLKSMLLAGDTMHQSGKPIVLDPVGAGFTAYRLDAARQIIRVCHPTIIRGNASEIRALADGVTSAKGVDTVCSSTEVLPAAQSMAQTFGCVVVVSGAVDYITDGRVVETVTNGSPMQTRVTGTGCVASALVAAMAAIQPNALQAAVSAMTLVGLAGEKAAARSQGTGSMQVNFLDELSSVVIV